jgi:hypothetical protein
MLLQLLAAQPQMLGGVVANTPRLIWVLLAGLIVLGLSQRKDRDVTLRRVTITPLAMVAFSLWGTVTAFAASPQLGQAMLAWTGAAACALALIAPWPAPRGTGYDAISRRYQVPGSWLPLLLILGIFLAKYVSGVDLAMQPSLALDSQYALTVSALSGAFSGIFAGRAARLWRLALRPVATTPSAAASLQRNLWSGGTQ